MSLTILDGSRVMAITFGHPKLGGCVQNVDIYFCSKCLTDPCIFECPTVIAVTRDPSRIVRDTVMLGGNIGTAKTNSGIES